MKRFVLEPLVLMVVAALPAVLAARLQTQQIPWRDPLDGITTTSLEAIRSWDGPIIWIDARSEKEFDQGHIPEAISVSEDRFNTAIAGLVCEYTPGAKIVVYCSIKTCRSAKTIAARIKNEVGLEPVFVLKGGWEGWSRNRIGPG